MVLVLVNICAPLSGAISNQINYVHCSIPYVVAV